MKEESRKYQETCLVLMTGLLVLWLVYPQNILIIIALGIGISALFIPVFAKGIYWVWYKTAEVLGWVMSKVLLTLIFFLFLTPIAILARWFRKNDPLGLKKPKVSNWTERQKSFSGSDLESPW